MWSVVLSHAFNHFRVAIARIFFIYCFLVVWFCFIIIFRVCVLCIKAIAAQNDAPICCCLLPVYFMIAFRLITTKRKSVTKEQTTLSLKHNRASRTLDRCRSLIDFSYALGYSVQQPQQQWRWRLLPQPQPQPHGICPESKPIYDGSFLFFRCAHTIYGRFTTPL